jgi:hypothetical protein
MAVHEEGKFVILAMSERKTRMEKKLCKGKTTHKEKEIS